MVTQNHRQRQCLEGNDDDSDTGAAGDIDLETEKTIQTGDRVTVTFDCRRTNTASVAENKHVVRTK